MEHGRDNRFERVSIDRRDVSEPEPIIMPYSHLKLPSFGGETGKGEVTWDCFKFEIELLITGRLSLGNTYCMESGEQQKVKWQTLFDALIHG